MLGIRTIEVYSDHYRELCEEQLLLFCLRKAGVENWSGYRVALEYYDAYKENDE